MPLSPTIQFSNSGLLEYYGRGHSKTIMLPPSITYQQGQILAQQLGVNAQQSVTIGGSPTGGTFTLTYSAQTTAGIPYNATALQVQNALNALSNVTAPAFAVTGSAGGPYTVTFGGTLGLQVQSLLTGSNAGLSPTGTVTIASVTIGSGSIDSLGRTGVYYAWDPSQVDGRQIPIGPLRYQISTDANGNCTMGGSGAGLSEWNATTPYTDMFFQGVFLCADLVGLNDAAIAASRDWMLITGNVANGLLSIPGGV